MILASLLMKLLRKNPHYFFFYVSGCLNIICILIFAIRKNVLRSVKLYTWLGKCCVYSKDSRFFFNLCMGTPIKGGHLPFVSWITSSWCIYRVSNIPWIRVWKPMYYNESKTFSMPKTIKQKLKVCGKISVFLGWT